MVKLVFNFHYLKEQTSFSWKTALGKEEGFNESHFEMDYKYLPSSQEWIDKWNRKLIVCYAKGYAGLYIFICRAQKEINLYFMHQQFSAFKLVGITEDECLKLIYC